MNDYDNQSQNVSSIHKKAAGKKKSKSKKKEKERSHSGDSMDRFNGQAEHEIVVDEDMEEDELLKRELGGEDTEHHSQS